MAAPLPGVQPLPPNLFHSDPVCHAAYEQCLHHEAEVAGDSEKIVYARCLGYMILETRDTGAQSVVADEIILCEGDTQKMEKLAQFYISHLFRLFRQNKGHTPIPSDHPSRPSFEMHKSFFATAIDPAPKDHGTAKKSALYRDGYRCMVTGLADPYNLSGIPEEQRQVYETQSLITFTNFCHIFPPSTNWGLKPQVEGHPKANYAGNVWAIINGFGHIDVLAELDGSNIHRLSNGLTMGIEVHQHFDNLRLWFEEVPNNANTYTVRTLQRCSSLRFLPNPLTVTFSTTTKLELPDPRYLRLHAAVCRVAHMSGAGEYMQQYERELEERKVMACDGSSAELLAYRLRQTRLS